MVGSFYEIASGGGGSTTTLDAYANTPAGPASGDEMVCTDSPLRRIYNGSAWLDFLPATSVPTTPMPTAGWTQAGTAPTSLTAVGGTRVVQIGAGILGYQRAAPATSWKVRSLFRYVTTDTSPDASTGIYLQETATNESLGIQANVQSATDRIYVVDRPNGSTSAAGQVIVFTGTPAVLCRAPFWLEAEYNAANVGSEIVFRVSMDGINFLEIATYAVGTYFTSAPDMSVVNFDPGGTTTTLYMQYLYDEITL
jgi:hypothetical protein